jgi:hypothetical protein
MIMNAKMMAGDMVRGQELKSKRLLAAVCAMGKALGRAVEMVRE